MDVASVAIGIVTGAATGGALAWIIRGNTVLSLTRENAELRGEKKTEAESHLQQVAQLTEIRQNIEDQFELLAGRTLKANSEEFVTRANDKISQLVQPLDVALKNYEGHLNSIEAARNASYGGLNNAIEAMRSQQDEVKAVTSSLVLALRSSPKTPGRWAEETLRRVMELSGMVEHCDFEMEKHFRGEDESLRPDALIYIAGGRSVVVDAKAPISAYLEAINAPSEEERELLLRKHASQLRERLTNLSKKSYWEKIDCSPDYVVMFVPGDNFVSAAFERDRSLFEDALAARVLICTPTTFIALAKSISYGWGQERLAAGALEVEKLGRELYSRLCALGAHVVELGTRIKRTTEKYNDFVGSLEGSVLPKARQFNELGVQGTSDPLPEAKPIKTVLRLPQPDRDLIIDQLPPAAELPSA